MCRLFSSLVLISCALFLLSAPASQAAEPPREPLPMYVIGLFRPSPADLKAAEKKLGAPIVPATIGDLANEKNQAYLHYLAGQIYEYGYDVPPDAAKAKEHYIAAAATDHPAATARMAWYTLENAPQNRPVALTMINKVITSDSPVPKINLALMQMLGFEGEEKVEPALKKLKALAYEDIPLAQYSLGAIYLDGTILPRDPETALSWLRPAAEAGVVEAYLDLALCYNQGIGVEISPELTFNYYLKAAQAGVTDAQHEVGQDYLNGRGIEKDYAQAALWLRKSADKGNPGSMASLGGLLATGPDATEESQKEGLVYLEKANALGHPLAQYFLAALYLNLTGTSTYYDFPKGEALLRASAEAGNPTAQTDLAQILRFGSLDGLKADKIEAARWALIATRADYPPARDLLTRIRSTMSEIEWQQAQQRANDYIKKAAKLPISGAVVR